MERSAHLHGFIRKPVNLLKRQLAVPERSDYSTPTFRTEIEGEKTVHTQP
jgi:hypothetical protein